MGFHKRRLQKLLCTVIGAAFLMQGAGAPVLAAGAGPLLPQASVSVSYTHLTLPTN